MLVFLISTTLAYYPRDAMRTVISARGLCCRRVSVRPSVTLHCIHVGPYTAEDVVKLLVWPGYSPINLVFDPICADPIPKGTPSAGVLNPQGGKIGVFRLKSPDFMVTTFLEVEYLKNGAF